jgi:hypothetical protein
LAMFLCELSDVTANPSLFSFWVTSGARICIWVMCVGFDRGLGGSIFYGCGGWTPKLLATLAFLGDASYRRRVVHAIPCWGRWGEPPSSMGQARPLPGPGRPYVRSLDFLPNLTNFPFRLETES